MKKTHIVMVSFNVEGFETLNQANECVKKRIRGLGMVRDNPFSPEVTSMEVQEYFEVDEGNQRVFYVHPEDTDANYDPVEYRRKLEEERAEDGCGEA